MYLKKKKEKRNKNQSVFFKRSTPIFVPAWYDLLDREASSYLHGLARRTFPSLIDFLDVVACDTELHFLDRVSRVAANVIFFFCFFRFFFFCFIGWNTQWTRHGATEREKEQEEAGEVYSRRGREREREIVSQKKKKNADASMMDARSRGHFLKLFKNRVFRANNARME